MKKGINFAEAASKLKLDREEITEFLLKYNYHIDSDETEIPLKLFEELEVYASGKNQESERKSKITQQQESDDSFNQTVSSNFKSVDWIFPDVNIYAAYVYNDDQIYYKYYIENDLWELHQYKIIPDDLKKAKEGDLVFLVSNNPKTTDKPATISIRAIAKISRFEKSKKVILAKWHQLVQKPIVIYGSGIPKGPFTRLPEYTVEKLNSDMQLDSSDMKEIIKNLDETVITNESSKSKIESIIENKLLAEKQFWWLNIKPEKWSDDLQSLNENVSYGTRKSNGDLKSYVGRMKMGDLILAYHASPNQLIKGVFQVVSIDLDTAILFELLYIFENQTSLDDIRLLKSFENSALSKSIQGGLRELNEKIFIDIINTTELSVGSKKSVKMNPSLIAVLNADSENGEDYFGISKDVESFAKIISSEHFIPPLAIALFGQWGTGKSFFMKKLREKIQELTTSGNPNLYIEGIAPIHFNAWSYMDTNLWASLVTKIFEELQTYISGNTETDELKHQVQQELNNRLGLLKEERSILETQKRNDEERLELLQKKEFKLETELKQRIDTIKSASLKAILENVDEQFNVNGRLQESLGVSVDSKKLNEIRTIVPEKYWKEPDLAIKELKSAGTFIREFYRGKNTILSIVLIVLVLVIIALIPLLGIGKFKETNPFSLQVILSSIAILIPFWIRFTATFDKLRPFVKAFWKIKSDHENAVKNAIFVHEQTMEATKIEIANKRSELLNIHEQTTQINSHIKVLDFKLENALSTQTLYSFIERRAKSDVYHKELGIVSMIRNDFKILSELFAEKEMEDQHKEFRNYFTSPLRRIVLYIDDLDRCPEDRVIEVLEAVNLLMAFPLFVVVVGVDPRWVKNALIKKYHMQFTGKYNGAETGLAPIDATNYLEKIFQVPFHLKRASDVGVKHMLKELSIIETEETEESVQSNASGTFEINDKKTKPLDAKIKALLKDKEVNLLKIEKNINQEEIEIDSSTVKEIERFVLSQKEVELIQAMSRIIGNNPRAIKRFVNVYHIVRAHEGLSINNHSDDEYLILMFLLAFPMGPFKKLHSHFIKYINELKDDKSVFDDFFQMDFGEFNELKNQIRTFLDEVKVLDKLKQIPIKKIKEHNRFVQRFTFSELTL